MPPSEPVDSAAVIGRVREDLARRDLLRGVDRLLVACSGGGDSVALMDVLARLADEVGVRLGVVHVDHGTRPEEAAAETRLVQRLAAERGLDLRVERLSRTGSASEAELRRERLEAFARVGARWSASAVALGHSLDDRAETVLLNAARGCGPAGLGALGWRRRVAGVLLLRPLLGLRRRALREYLRARRVDWCEDSSNDSERYTRNRLRTSVLPDLEEIIPGAHEALARLAELADRDEDWLRDLARRELDVLRADEELPGGLAVDAAGLAARHPGLASRIVRLALGEVRGHLRGLDRDHFEAALGVAAGEETARDLPGVRVHRQGGRLRVLPLENRRLAGVAGPIERANES